MNKKNQLLLLFVALFPVLLHAQSKLPDNMFLRTLPNGMDVLVIEDNSVPLATIMITCKNGSYTETPKFNGLSHLYEHMFFKANKDYSSQEEFLNRVNELGIKFNGSTTYENVNYYFTLPKFNLAAGLTFMNSAIRYPMFDKREMAGENDVVDGEFQRHESSPMFALSDAMDHHMWGDLYSRKNSIGNHEVIRMATPDLMDSIKNKYYFPNNSLLTIAGDVEHEDVFNKVEQIYGSWKSSGFDPFKKWPIPEFKPLEKSDYFIVESKLTQVPIVLIEWQGPDTRNDVNSTYAADVFSYILNQNSSTLKKALVQSGLALDVRINYLTLKHVGPITLLVVPNPNKIKECMAEVKKQLTLMDNDNYVTDEQIETAKQKLGIIRVREEEVASDFVQVLSFWWSSASLDYFTTYNDRLNKATRADLQSYVRKYIKNKPYCAGLLINPDLEAQVVPQNFFTASN
ncbi:M16 family metallopeptidase [Mucilaginibacter sp. SP1R1]|uniref:M16 family metallopeptidase n=1 Tax=Mucilaginibacter sp. SP1R1 TaxID=2723091 RepID=UPI001613D20F|nr:pitrilysin family protein [Mucilaginibacter sp. SP1R1]MBB6151057.1 zinc protease [Mucilaginibacter sp. SP1R1]